MARKSTFALGPPPRQEPAPDRRPTSAWLSRHRISLIAIALSPQVQCAHEWLGLFVKDERHVVSDYAPSINCQRSTHYCRHRRQPEEAHRMLEHPILKSQARGNIGRKSEQINRPGYLQVRLSRQVRASEWEFLEVR